MIKNRNHRMTTVRKYQSQIHFLGVNCCELSPLIFQSVIFQSCKFSYPVDTLRYLNTVKTTAIATHTHTHTHTHKHRENNKYRPATRYAPYV